MKVLVSSHTGNFSGGAERSLLLFLTSDSAKRFRLKVVVPYTGFMGDFQKELEENGVDVVKVEKHTDITPLERYLRSPRVLLKRLLGNVRFAWRYQRLLKEFKPDRVYLNTTRCEVDGLIAYLNKVPVVWHIRGAENDFKGIRRLRILFIGLVSSKVIAVNHGLRDRLVTFNRAFRRKVEYVPNGIAIESVRSDPTVEMEIKSEWNLRGKRIVGTVGTLEETKNPLAFCEIAEWISRKRSDVSFVWVGTVHDDVLDSVRHRYAHLIEKGVLLFAGYQRNTISWINLFEVFVLTSVSEGFPRVILEAGALRKPIVSYNIDGVRDFLVDGVTGFLVEPGDNKSLALTVNSLLDKFPDQVVDTAFRKVRDEFNLESINARISEIISA